MTSRASRTSPSTASKFSTYAIGYTAQTTTPVTPPSQFSNPTIYYTLTATAGQGGSISPSGKISVHRNGTKTFTIIPDEGYSVTDVMVDGKSVGAVREYTFEKVTTNHTIEASFQEHGTGYKTCLRDNTCPIAKFTDADAAAWYHDGVHYCIENGLMNGYGNRLFGPNDTLTRGMLAQILYNEAGRPAVSGNSPFDDVNSSVWYADAVTWAAAKGIVEGYGNGKFGPKDAITREQIAAILWRCAQVGGEDVSVGENTNILSYQDFAEISEWAIPALQWTTGSGLMTGKGNGILDPASQATRAETAAMFQRHLAR